MENSFCNQFRGEYFEYLYQNELEVGLFPTPHRVLELEPLWLLLILLYIHEKYMVNTLDESRRTPKAGVDSRNR